MLHLLLRNPESQQHPHRHGKRQTLALPVESAAQLESKMNIIYTLNNRPPSVPVDINGLRVGAPNTEALLDDLLDFWEVGFQGLVTKHFGKHLWKHSERHVVSCLYMQTFIYLYCMSLLFSSVLSIN